MRRLATVSSFLSIIAATWGCKFLKSMRFEFPTNVFQKHLFIPRLNAVFLLKSNEKAFPYIQKCCCFLTPVFWELFGGCNALSIIILFVSFIIAFAQRFKKTLFYIFAGVVIIYSVNILRITILAIALYNYPEYQHMLHGAVFPGIIYGMVFLLWLIWVQLLIPKTNPR